MERTTVTTVGSYDLLGSMNISKTRQEDPSSPKFAIQATFFKLSPSSRGKVYQFQSYCLRGECAAQTSRVKPGVGDSAASNLNSLPSLADRSARDYDRWNTIIRESISPSLPPSLPPSVAAVRSGDKRKKSSNFRENFAVYSARSTDFVHT